ncbi:hypothetical protein BB559_000252 [Furculomyces boomerangus]|uniref:Ribosome biogenesis protein SLX9 n=2 Tax=Harpellales TaxID=61421 RepID=A0A2T9Z5S4_9FUNG|nr:hypothetical protein BB559_000252 [Furculomyces boomerangus]PVZ97183.1 hypothetical protein BB558_006877 [Smittium angustum]PWA00173.1 hypothetical protein BB558_003786 [Smittium angustum]
MPKVRKQRVKYHLTVSDPQSSIAETTGKQIFTKPNQNDSIQAPGKWKIASDIIQETKTTSTQKGGIISGNLISAPVLLDSGNIEKHSKPKTISKKEKSVARHKTWLNKLEVASERIKAEHNKKSNQRNKSTLLEGLKQVKNEIFALKSDDLSTNPKKQKKNTFDKPDQSIYKKVGNPNKRTKKTNKAINSEITRFNQILSNPTYKSDPLETIKMHLSNTYN